MRHGCLDLSVDRTPNGRRHLVSATEKLADRLDVTDAEAVSDLPWRMMSGHSSWPQAARSAKDGGRVPGE